MVKTLMIIILCFSMFVIITTPASALGINLNRIGDGIWVHTTYYDENGSRKSSNGLVVETKDGLIMVDTAGTPEQTENLIQWAEKQCGSKFFLAIITNWQQDRSGGIETLRKHQIEIISTSLTAKLANKAGYGLPESKITGEVKQLQVGGIDLEIYYPGPAHTMDNVVVYLPAEQILFGGSIIKSMQVTKLGDLADGDRAKYGATVKNIINLYPDVVLTIPGQGDWGLDLLTHTLELAERK